MAEIEIRAERLEQYEQKAIEKQHNRRKNQMLNQGFSVSKFCVGDHNYKSLSCINTKVE